VVQWARGTEAAGREGSREEGGGSPFRPASHPRRILRTTRALVGDRNASGGQRGARPAGHIATRRKLVARAPPALLAPRRPKVGPSWSRARGAVCKRSGERAKAAASWETRVYAASQQRTRPKARPADGGAIHAPPARETWTNMQQAPAAAHMCKRMAVRSQRPFPSGARRLPGAAAGGDHQQAAPLSPWQQPVSERAGAPAPRCPPCPICAPPATAW
jgi:hypothetical protein